MTYAAEAKKMFESGWMGCVMLDVTPVDLDGVIPDEWCYSTTNPARSWISGRQSEFHVTLLYGLLDNANEIKTEIDEALDGWDATSPLTSDAISVFESPFEDDPYSCIVAEFDDPRLNEAHGRLSKLPHINTFPDYRPHVTLAYVHKDRTRSAVDELRRHFGARDVYCPIQWEPTGLNYGREG